MNKDHLAERERAGAVVLGTCSHNHKEQHSPGPKTLAVASSETVEPAWTVWSGPALAVGGDKFGTESGNCASLTTGWPRIPLRI